MPGCSSAASFRGAPPSRGSVTVKVEPSPGALATAMEPPTSSSTRLTMASPSPLPPRGVRGVALIELVEDALLRLRRHAAAVVADGDKHAFALRARGQFDAPARRRKLHRVADEVVPHRFQHALVVADRHVGDVHGKVDAFFLPGVHLFQRAAPQLFAELIRLSRRRRLLLLHLAQAQYVAHHAAQPPRGVDHRVRAVAPLGGGERLVLEGGGIALDDGQRRFELVRYAGI